MRLKGKTAIVTGAASGIGKAIAVLYAREGANVVVTDLNEEGAKQTAAEIGAEGGKAIAVQANVASQADIDRLFAETVNTYGTLDVLVNNAGVMDGFEPVGDVNDEQWDRVIAVNTTSVMRTSRKAVELFLPKENGSIINIASVGGLNGGRAGAAYTASKFAVIGLTKNTAFMYAQKGIRCNAIAPGAVETNIAASMGQVNPSGYSRMQLTLPLNPRAGKPEEIAGLALFLASDESRYVNGAIIPVDGGWTTA
jgi:NAD(P)-dependent dehydrogenase (short-subunit alcohol dehydrogenase family)